MTSAQSFAQSFAPPSPFLDPPSVISPTSEAPSIIHQKRDLVTSVTFGSAPTSTLNTRFGDFPHSTLTKIPYGSQVRAACTGRNAKKRKRTAEKVEEEDEDAPSGFIHILAPTAELWTTSLPHRTQVVYTPDSSYILHRLGVKPGSVVIEAGAGSGSFSHAAVRAVYSGYPDGREGEWSKHGKKGKVWSFEFHQQRVEKLRSEIKQHGLDGLVELVHRDVCKDGFLAPVKSSNGEIAEDTEFALEAKSPEATAVFLDLPAPWLAIPHLSRATDSGTPTVASTALTSDPDATVTATLPLASFLDPTSSEPAKLSVHTSDGDVPLASSTPPPALFVSPLRTNCAVRMCSFSPCIEQVTRTVAVLRKHGWVDIDMVEVQHARMDIRRHHQKGYEDGAGPKTVQEALERQREVGRYREEKREVQIAETRETKKPRLVGNVDPVETLNPNSKDFSKEKKIRGPDEGRIMSRLESELKSHTSYLTFATLPREWSEEDEMAASMAVEKVSKGIDKGVVGAKEKRWLKKDEGEDRPPSKRMLKRMEQEKRKKPKESEGECHVNSRAKQTL